MNLHVEFVLLITPCETAAVERPSIAIFIFLVFAKEKTFAFTVTCPYYVLFETEYPLRNWQKAASILPECCVFMQSAPYDPLIKIAPPTLGTRWPAVTNPEAPFEFLATIPD